MNNSRFYGVLSLVGGLTAVLILIAFFLTGWDSPGTVYYQTYERLNRLMAVALLFMAGGWLGVWRVSGGYGRWVVSLAFIGVLITSIGTAAEFWLYTDLPYEGGNMRQTAFTVVSIGGWLLIIGATGMGVTIWRYRFWPRWSAIIMLLALPIDIVAFFLLRSPFVSATMFALILGGLLFTKTTNPKQVSR